MLSVASMSRHIIWLFIFALVTMKIATAVIAQWIYFVLTLCEGFNLIVKRPLYPISLQVLQKKHSRPILPTRTSNNNRCVSSSYPYERNQPSTSSSILPNSNDDDSSSPEEKEDPSVLEKQEEEETTKLSILQKLKKSFSKKEKKDDLTFRQRLAKMGLAAVLSYGMVSNVSYSISVSLAWYIFSSRTGLSPLAKGQWKPFLAVYAGFFVFNNIIRPVRLALSVAVSVKFDELVNWMQKRFGVKKAMAYTLCVVVFNLFGTTFLMCAGIFLASIAAGVPIFVPKT